LIVRSKTPVSPSGVFYFAGLADVYGCSYETAQAPASRAFFPGAPSMVRERLKGTSPATQHGVLAGGAMGFCGLN
jgi:hypothetical protein